MTAQRADHFCIGGAGADEHADARPRNDHVEPERHGNANHDQCKPIDRVSKIFSQLQRARQDLGCRDGQRSRPPDHFHRLVDEQDDAEGGEHLVEMVAVIQVSEDQHFQRQAENECRQQAKQQRCEEVAGQPEEQKSQVSADHVLHAMGQVDEAHDAEDQRQPGRDQKQQHAVLQTVEDLNEEQCERHLTATQLKQCYILHSAAKLSV